MRDSEPDCQRLSESCQDRIECLEDDQMDMPAGIRPFNPKTSKALNHETFENLTCPLCRGADSALFHRDARRSYFRCEQCRLVFVTPDCFLSPDEEKIYYDLHQNDPEDAGYRRFLSRLAAPLASKLIPGAHGLDFGSGPGPTLSLIMKEAGFRMEIFDPIFAPSSEVWEQKYDFVTASEVVEHLREPMSELQRVWELIKPGGWLGIMTKRVIDAEAFARWHYKEDPTHVVFFATETFAWLAVYWSASLEIVGPDVVLFRKMNDAIE